MKKRLNKLGDDIVTNANNEHILTNRDTDKVSTFFLDATISPGMRVTVTKLANFSLTVQASAGETIIDSTPGGYLRHTAPEQIMASVTLLKTDNTKWTVERGFRTWKTDGEGV